MMKRACFPCYLIVFFLLVSCASQKPTAAKLLVEIQKTSCMGPCPVYKLQVFDNGIVNFVGESDVEMIGEYVATLTKEQLEELTTKFTEIDFFELQDKYVKRTSDFPTTYLTYVDGDRTKKIMDYYGAPDELKELENFIDSYRQSLDWKKR